ncbi:RICIN domain-containing protein [Kitasatospora viridis]|uniref:Uncharacterized protein n=1 Tax=Kitasatospora viridis TaxID=281105 RepID=A0A561SAH1_9ACTN|nr:RICIN domain-containing protein [Kitasatospora viridis]TWF71837.1 hypothetical protein FHX73_1734 [Kitasatospora viridis]
MNLTQGRARAAKAAALATIAWTCVLGAPGSASAMAPGTNPQSWPATSSQWINLETGNCLSSDAGRQAEPGAAANVNTEACGYAGIPYLPSLWLDPSLGQTLYYEILRSSWDGQESLSSTSDDCLDSNNAISNGKQGYVYVIPCNWNNWQMWSEMPTTGGHWTLTNYHTGLALDAGPGGGNADGIYANTPNGNPWQTWQ